MEKKVVKVVFTGPESTGKTSLSKLTAAHYNTSWVSEYARDYLQKIHRPYTKKDVVNMAKGQFDLEQSFVKKVENLLICDTDMIVFKIWMLHKYGVCDNWILKKIQENSVDLYFLCSVEVPWQYDPLRENPNERKMLHESYRTELQRMNKPFVELEGSIEEQMQTVTNAIDLIVI